MKKMYMASKYQVGMVGVIVGIHVMAPIIGKSVCNHVSISPNDKYEISSSPFCFEPDEVSIPLAALVKGTTTGNSLSVAAVYGDAETFTFPIG